MNLKVKQAIKKRRRGLWLRFRSNRRGYWSFVLFSLLFCISLVAEVVSNDRPLIVGIQGTLLFPVVVDYPETTFGGVFETSTDYSDPFVLDVLNRPGNFALFPPIRFSFDSINENIDGPVPAPPGGENYFGTDDRGRDVLARLIYGFRISVLFGLALAAVGTAIGVIAGAIQGYFGGRTDLLLQRGIEIWGSMPELYLLIIFASMFSPGFLLLLVLLSLFSWMGLSDYVRAEFLRGRNLDYVRAARSLGVRNVRIMWRHLLPNGLTPVLTFLPFRVSASILALTSLDFLGLGVPPSTPSLGELLAQGKANLEAWWLSLSAFGVLIGMLVLLIFIGEALRETFDPRSARRGGR